jgi:hypothetical protein
MPLKIDCPRCKHRLSVAERKAGSYARCPQCRARLWIPDAEGEGSPGTTALAVRRGPAAPAAPPVGNGRQANVARLISVEAAFSSLKLIDDGQLPELRLHESAAGGPAKPAAAVNPLLTIILLCLSAVASVAVLFMFDGQQQSAQSAKKQSARAAIAKDFFAEMDGLPHYPYQSLLRDAQRAHLRGDFRQERELYRQVLELLRAERKPEAGVTGSPGRDQELERHLTVLLGN